MQNVNVYSVISVSNLSPLKSIKKTPAVLIVIVFVLKFAIVIRYFKHLLAILIDYMNNFNINNDYAICTLDAIPTMYIYNSLNLIFSCNFNFIDEKTGSKLINLPTILRAKTRIKMQTSGFKPVYF